MSVRSHLGPKPASAGRSSLDPGFSSLMSKRELVQITRTIWDSVLPFELLDAEPPSTASEASLLKGAVHISGPWTCTVVVECALELSARIAKSLLDAEPELLTEDDIRDAVGELTNMIGGNIKALLPKPCRLSTPSVDEYRYSVQPWDGEIVQRVGFTSEGSLLTVAVLRSTQAAPA